MRIAYDNEKLKGEKEQDQPTKVHVWRSGSPDATHCRFRTASISETCGGNEARRRAGKNGAEKQAIAGAVIFKWSISCFFRYN
jgi:hypothetical protein